MDVLFDSLDQIRVTLGVAAADPYRVFTPPLCRSAELAIVLTLMDAYALSAYVGPGEVAARQRAQLLAKIREAEAIAEDLRGLQRAAYQEAARLLRSAASSREG
jgi:hypothetical protein